MRTLPPPPVLVSLLVWVSAAAALPGQQHPQAFPKPDHEIRIGVLPGRLRYDTEQFAVRPGSKVQLSLVNTCEMLHNLLICKPGKGVIDKVAKAALELGGEASTKHFAPDIPEVLFKTRAILPEQTDTIWFTAPREPGDYPYVCTLPGHTFTMRGVMKVGEVRPELLSNLHYRLFSGRFQALSELDMQTPTRRGALPDGVIDVHALGAERDYGAWFHGRLQLARAGTYKVYLRSDDGSRVRIDGTTVVAHDGVHGVGPERQGEIELGAGPHELWVEYFQGRGGKELHVAIEGPGLPRRSLTATGSKAPAGIPIAVHHEPVVMRVHIENASPRGIAVGLPGGMNCVFDAETCRVQFGWAGAFLDVGPDRLGRGGRPCKILGQRFEVGGDGFRMQMGDVIPTVRFRGYRTLPEPCFEFDWYGRPVSWTVRAAPQGVGLQYTIRIPGLQASDVVDLCFGEGLQVDCASGSFRDGWLRVPGTAAQAFAVTVTRPEGGER